MFAISNYASSDLSLVGRVARGLVLGLQEYEGMMLIGMRKCSNSVPLLEEYPRQWGVSSVRCGGLPEGTWEYRNGPALSGKMPTPIFISV